MASLQLSFLFLAAVATHCLAASPAAPAPAPEGKLSLEAILQKGGQFTTFLKLLSSTQVESQVDNQVKSNSEGMTVFAPTDNAFQNLKAGTVNSLSAQQQVDLVLLHCLPKFYSLNDFETVSNPVRTQASGSDGQSYGLNITSQGNNQVNVSSGAVVTQVNNALSDQAPLAVYQIDKVLLPEDIVQPSKAKAPSSSPVSSSPTKTKGSGSKADAPTGQAADEKNVGFGVRSMGLGLVFGVGLATFGFLS